MRTWLPLLWLTGCVGGSLAVPTPWIAPSVDALEIDDAVPDASTLVSFEIANTGTGRATVRLAIDVPFVAVTPTLDIPAGGVGIATVRFDAVGYAPADAVLVLDAGHGLIEVPVRARVDDDVDDDGAAAEAAGGGDCDDGDPDVHPDLTEVCDGLDNDCSGVADDVEDPPLWWPDADEDGYGDETAEPVAVCERPAVGWVTSGADCDDTRLDVHPGAVEIWYDGVDQNCDAGSDYDRDGDGWDSTGFGGADCADSDPDVHPEAVEVADGIDNDCDGVTS